MDFMRFEYEYYNIIYTVPNVIIVDLGKTLNLFFIAFFSIIIAWYIIFYFMQFVKYSQSHEKLAGRTCLVSHNSTGQWSDCTLIVHRMHNNITLWHCSCCTTTGRVSTSLKTSTTYL